MYFVLYCVVSSNLVHEEPVKSVHGKGGRIEGWTFDKFLDLRNGHFHHFNEFSFYGKAWKIVKWCQKLLWQGKICSEYLSQFTTLKSQKNSAYWADRLAIRRAEACLFFFLQPAEKLIIFFVWIFPPWDLKKLQHTRVNILDLKILQVFFKNRGEIFIF